MTTKTRPSPAIISKGQIAAANDPSITIKTTRAAGQFIVHPTFGRFSRHWTVTLPTGIALGNRYANKACAKAAAAAMAPLVLDYHGMTIEAVFGEGQAARDAYDAARAAANAALEG